MEQPKSTPGTRGRRAYLSLDEPTLSRKQKYNIMYRERQKAKNGNMIETRTNQSLDDDGLTKRQISALKHRIANYDARREVCRLWREQNQDRVKEYNKRYYAEKKKKFAEIVDA